MPPAPRSFRLRILLVPLFLAGLFLFFKQSYQVPVLMYHHVGSLTEKSSLNVSVETFERQMEFLKVHRYEVISLLEFLDGLKNHKSFSFKTVVITFDDGNLDNIENAFPVLKKMHFPATIFMITDNINQPGWLSEEDLRILDQSGISIGSHTVHHAYLPDLEPDQITFELRESKRRLEEVLGHPVKLLCYPAGGFNPDVKMLAQKLEYSGAVTTNRGKTPLDPYALRRVKITEGRGSLFNFWAKISGLYSLGKKRIEGE